ncbi:MAG: arabinan endo-1,5-alpha-L-arabinosidase [Paucibacter sp.]|nr:arabinan endo-1,5-alpha-L-arabinosidase [Roseateles sp.]
MKVKQLAAVGLAALLACAPLQALELQGDTRAHDPTLLVEQGRHHIFTTGAGIQRLSSADGKTWLRQAPVFSEANKPAWWATVVPEHKGLDVWAPKLFKHAGRFWVMYSISTFGKNVSAIGLASAESPEARDWRDDGLVVASGFEDNFNAIDPDVLIDNKDGRLWFSYGSFWGGIRLSELDRKTLKPIGETRFIARRKGGIEAPTLMQRGGWYYQFVSHDFCCRGVESSYNIRVGRAKNVWGPYLDKDGVAMTEGGGSLIEAGGPRWKGPGHQDVVGNTLVRHAYDAEDGGKPHLRIDPLRWSADGWPSL